MFCSRDDIGHYRKTAPMTDEHELVARAHLFETSHGSLDRKYVDPATIRRFVGELASTISRVLGERDDAVKARTTAIGLMTEAARDAGEWKGKFETSELCGIVEGWQTRALTAEARVERLEGALRAIAEGQYPPSLTAVETCDHDRTRSEGCQYCMEDHAAAALKDTQA